MTAGRARLAAAPAASQRAPLEHRPYRAWRMNRRSAPRHGGAKATPEARGGLCHVWLHASRRLQLSRLVGEFPGEVGLFAAEVPVARGARVDRPQEVEHLNDALG